MYNHKFVTSIDEVSPLDWQSLCTNNLFCSYPWLSALEQSGCVSSKTGWQPHHLLIYQDTLLVAILPGYLKSHSYGEYVFDWTWAEAYQRHGLEYYPKWLCGVPFTPVTGQRILCKKPTPSLCDYIFKTLKRCCAQACWSGAHINFLTEQLSPSNDFVRRDGVQFHWHNNHYKDFVDFLSALTSRRRKMIKKERQQALKYGLSIRWLSADEIDDTVLAQFYQCYQNTYIKRSGHQGYLNFTFFQLVLRTLPQSVRLCVAFDERQLVAASLYLSDKHTLYGRYWGALEDYQALHFELCYYQGIEYAIKHQLYKFDAGAQGEHKLTRGFEPVTTYSLHHIANPMFSEAISDFIQRERRHIAQYKEQCALVLPFKQQ
ncbi:GNAT family N-acetyltransferase [Pseudoalteromonas sp. S16_S37]|uniref:GNAT family N-acetyltransferase n=1 Tax=Pseudoalteromonas sp. S16_S37 TaxID=2720228 RepID=UPI001680F4C8|nr:GNAT family N-acetyltransferase [Pseudoalteromonas sp. S16_S37]MBD1582731.1 N-acetyltransferase [Pseudoalteromonas sp. S16_S37]